MAGEPRGGEIVGLSWLIAPYGWRLDARVIEPTVALAVDAVALRAWMNEDAALGRALAMRLVAQLHGRLERARLQRLDLYQAGPAAGLPGGS